MESPAETVIVDEQPAKPTPKKKLWLGLALGGSVLTGAVLVLIMSLRSPSDSNLPALSPDDLEQQKYDTQQTEREQQKAAGLRNQPFVMRKEDAYTAAQLNSLMNQLQLEPKSSPSASLKDSQVQAEEEAIAAVIREPRSSAASQPPHYEPRSVRRPDSADSNDSRGASQPMFVYSRSFGGAKYVDGPRKDSAETNSPQTAGASTSAPKPSIPAAIEKAAKPDKATLLYTQHAPVTLYEGEMLDGILVNRIVADTEPSPVICQISKDVYDNSGQFVLFPANSRILGVSQVVTYKGAHRLFISFHRIILPNGPSVDLPSSQKALSAMDESGALGVASKVDRHWFLQFGTAIFLGVLDGLGAAAQRNADLFSATSIIIDRTSGNFDRILDRIMAQYSSIVPTITVNQGKKVRIYLSDDILVSPFARISERSYYANR